MKWHPVQCKGTPTPAKGLGQLIEEVMVRKLRLVTQVTDVSKPLARHWSRALGIHKGPILSGLALESVETDCKYQTEQGGKIHSILGETQSFPCFSFPLNYHHSQHF